MTGPLFYSDYCPMMIYTGYLPVAQYTGPLPVVRIPAFLVGGES